MTDACRIDFCMAPAERMTLWGGHVAQLFCAAHLHALVNSPEGLRIERAETEGRLTRHVLVAALVDFRTRVELEHQRDGDPQVVAARGGTK